MSIATIYHPDYTAESAAWEKYRYVLSSGTSFIYKYLQRHSTRETDADFITRRSVTYCPSFAKAALIDIRNAIYQRTTDIRRVGGGKSYNSVISGASSGVDLHGNSMDGFIGRTVLTELLAMRRVGVFVDKQPIPENATLRDTAKIRPYLYIFRAEDIQSWSYDKNNVLDKVLLRVAKEVQDPETGLAMSTEYGYKYMYRENGTVVVEDYDLGGKLLDTTVLKIRIIPLAIFELTNSILEDAADYQISLMNMESSDINYILKANFPFYTEQYAPNFNMHDSMGQPEPKAIEAGVAKGRRYPAGMDRPDFIAPPTAPLMASMAKGEAIKADIRRIVNLNVSSITPTRASAESKATDMQGLEAGLAYIGTELQYGENQIATIWAEYEGDKPAIVMYPTRYTLTSIDERVDTAKKIREEMPMVPSKTYQKEMAKEVATQLIGSKVDSATLSKIHSEIDRAEIVITDPDILKQDHEAGFVSTATASKSRGYAEGEWIQAGKDHAERAARIVMAQTEARDSTAAGADDMGTDAEAGKNEKKDSQSPDKAVNGEKGVRS